MKRLIPINSKNEIPENYINTPIEKLLMYHNCDVQLDKCTNAELLIGMCMDNRKNLRIPDNFAFIIRSGGANLRYSEFKVSFAISIGKIRHIVLIGHNHCGMVNLVSKKEQFVSGLVDATGWEKEMAEDHFMHFAPMFEIGNEVDFVMSEAKRMRLKYPKITIVPMMYLVEDNKLYLLQES